MYRLTNLTLNTTTTYKNKDLVYQALERENAKVKHHESEGILLVEELDKKGVVIDQEEIYLPFDGIADSLFLKNGQSTTADPKLTEKKGQEQSFEVKESRDNQDNGRFSVLKILWHGLLLIGLIVNLAMAGVTTPLILKQGKDLSHLSQEVKDLKSLQSETGKLDTFVRYFLPHYYSDQGALDDFLAPALDFNHQTGQLQSVILESIAQTGDKTYQLTYVLAIKEGDNRPQKRLRVTVKAVSFAVYGYQVIQEPKLTDYPG
ncbi:hypothetical protein [Streptococcus merionis]|uniref:hypothetical protein n=1 Tax=Streptococcus merionis TaxID=400065 RepID=UPI0026EBB47A|nr:hypothetical protein [Streptococcus merionis]